MGFFSGLWKGIKSAVKGIGKGIKSAVGKVGKFMDRIGIVGQIAMTFILPGIGGLLSQGVGALQAMGGIAGGIGNVLATAGKFASTVGNAFKTVTDGILGFVGNVGGSFINQAASFLGKEGLLIKGAPATVGEGFGKWMTELGNDAMNITSPFRKVADSTSSMVGDAWEKSFGAPRSLSDKLIGDDEVFTAENVFDVDFDAIRDIPDVDVLTNDQPFALNIPNDAVQALRDAENSESQGFFSRITDHVIDTAKGLPEAAVDLAAETVLGGVGTAVQGALGLTPPTPDFITNVTNVPEFNSAPITSVYEQNGFNYGALPENRLQYFAAQGLVQQDFGIGSFQQFIQRRAA